MMMSSFLLLSGCGQYGGLYLPNAKKPVAVEKKAAEDPSSIESVVESDTPP